MADIISLEGRARPDRPKPAADASAQILFFTGVRYVRIADAIERPSRPKRGGKPAGATKPRRRA